MSNDVDADEEEIDEEEQAAKDAFVSRQLLQILAKDRAKDRKAPLINTILSEWKYLGSIKGYDGYAGQLCNETVYKFPKTGKGKVKLFDEYVALVKGGRLVLNHMVKYKGGKRESNEVVFFRIAEDVAE